MHPAYIPSAPDPPLHIGQWELKQKADRYFSGSSNNLLYAYHSLFLRITSTLLPTPSTHTLTPSLGLHTPSQASTPASRKPAPALLTAGE